MKTTINEDFCFKPGGYTIKETQEALAYYQQQKRDASEWLLRSDIPIFLDANVLLDLYRISLPERESFRKFLLRQKTRVFITGQVQEEYLRHRLQQINNFTKKVNSLFNNFRHFQDKVLKLPQNALDSISEFKRLNSLTGDIGAKVFDEVWQLLQGEVINNYMASIQEAMENGSSELQAYIEECKNKTHYEYEDPFLEAIADVNIQPDLSGDEKGFLKDRYNQLLEMYNQHKEDSEEVSYHIFPGCGDRSKLKEGKDPCGDFLIYHELLRYVKESDKDILFVTNDVTKSDWVKATTREMYPHYIVNIHSQTKRMIYVLSANDFMPMSFESIIPDIDNESNETEEAVMDEASISPNIENPEIPQNQFTQENPKQPANEKHASSFRHINEEDFVRELSTALKWAKDYGDNYISETYFIHGILGSKRYEFQHSREILQKLIAGGQIISESENHDGRDIPCLHIKDDLENE